MLTRGAVAFQQFGLEAAALVLSLSFAQDSL